MGEKMRRRKAGGLCPDHRNLSKPGGFGGSESDSDLICERQNLVDFEGELMNWKVRD